MTEQGENTELKAVQAKKAAGQTLTPGEEVLIAVDKSNAAAGEAVERGSGQTVGTDTMPSAETP